MMLDMGRNLLLNVLLVMLVMEGTPLLSHLLVQLVHHFKVTHPNYQMMAGVETVMGILPFSPSRPKVLGNSQGGLWILISQLTMPHRRKCLMLKMIALLPRKWAHAVVPQIAHLLLPGILPPLELIITVTKAVVMKAGVAAATILALTVLLHDTVKVDLLVATMIVHRIAVKTILVATLEVGIMAVMLLEGMNIAILVVGMGAPETTVAAVGMIKDQSRVVAKTMTTEKSDPKSDLDRQMKRVPLLRLPQSPPLQVLAEDGGLT